MDGFAYGNARVRAMKSRLLSARELAALPEINTLEGLIAALTRTPYDRSVEAALARTSGLDCVREAFHNEAVATMKSLRSFYRNAAAEAVNLVLRRYDVINLKTILRGLARHAPLDEVFPALFPVGDLSGPLLSQLAHATDPQIITDTLASMSLRIAHPLMSLRVDSPGAGTAEMELALERWYYQDGVETLRQADLLGSALHAALQVEADLLNLQTVLRFTSFPEERKTLRQWLGSDELRNLFLGSGRLPHDRLENAASQTTWEAFVDALEGSPYEEPLRAGWRAFTRTGRLSEFERHLERYKLRWLAGQIARDPLGIGTPMGYLALKSNEMRNLRWIAWGIHLGLTQGEIRAELEGPP
jgi:V/A-type H+-transporting ATPase subunit C